MKFVTINTLIKIKLMGMFFLLSSCDGTETQSDASTSGALPIEGTWELVSESKIEKGDTTFSLASKDQRMIKIINKTHFSFLRHDLAGGKDSLTAQFVAGGGKYKLEGDQYKEHLEYCNFREWENNDFQFKVSINHDTLIQTGEEKVENLGVERIIIEKYVRVN